jgi:hypothetical protein
VIVGADAAALGGDGDVAGAGIEGRAGQGDADEGSGRGAGGVGGERDRCVFEARAATTMLRLPTSASAPPGAPFSVAGRSYGLAAERRDRSAASRCRARH